MITRDEILKGQKCPLELEVNLQDLVSKLSILRGIWGRPMIINSGYRNPEKNKQVGGAKNSAHLYCQAVDIRDLRGELGEWCLQNQEVLEEIGLWVESPHITSPKGYVHLQTRPAKSRVFNP
jgi:hypothetical protein